MKPTKKSCRCRQLFYCEHPALQQLQITSSDARLENGRHLPAGLELLARERQPRDTVAKIQYHRIGREAEQLALDRNKIDVSNRKAADLEESQGVSAGRSDLSV